MFAVLLLVFVSTINGYALAGQPTKISAACGIPCSDFICGTEEDTFVCMGGKIGSCDGCGSSTCGLFKQGEAICQFLSHIINIYGAYIPNIDDRCEGFKCTPPGAGKVGYTIDLTKLSDEPYYSLNMVIDDHFGELCGALKQWDPNDMDSYDAILKIGKKIVDKYDYRTVLCLPDGLVVLDTVKGGKNTFENAVNGNIDENHNTRVSIMSAQLNDEGKAWEEKLSTTDQQVENYVTTRCGNQFENFGTIRLSVISDTNGGSSECKGHNDCEKGYKCYEGTCISTKDYKNKKRLLLL